jgi:N6-L-threonylcarbamoyladenine synthase
MRVLGLESSCDETAVGIVCDDAASGQARILADIVATQLAEHRPYGGVVPEIAARAHLDKMDDLVKRALQKAELTLDSIDGIAATCGPGLIGGVMVGAMTGKALAAVTGKPFIAVNHLEAHALTARLTHDVAFPYLLLLVSGGHCQLVLVEGVSRYRRLGTTLDDAVGECFDKSAKLLGLGYPGGPLLEVASAGGDPKKFDLPHPMQHRAGCDFSFSGLKTAVRLHVAEAQKPLPESFVADMAASLQMTIAEILADRTKNAFALLDQDSIAPTALVVGGGVAANKTIRAALTALCDKNNLPFLAPPPALCTDNGVMIAWAGLERLRLGFTDDLSFRARPRWPLEELRVGTE